MGNEIRLIMVLFQNTSMLRIKKWPTCILMNSNTDYIAKSGSHLFSYSSHLLLAYWKTTIMGKEKEE